MSFGTFGASYGIPPLNHNDSSDSDSDDGPSLYERRCQREAEEQVRLQEVRELERVALEV